MGKILGQTKNKVNIDPVLPDVSFIVFRLTHMLFIYFPSKLLSDLQRNYCSFSADKILLE